MKDCDSSGFPSRYAVRPFSANPKSNSSRTAKYEYLGEQFHDGDELRTLDIANTELFRYLDEIRPANKAYSDLLSEFAQELDYFWRCPLLGDLDIKRDSCREAGLPDVQAITSHRHRTARAS
jgi:hypothetical protein